MAFLGGLLKGAAEIASPIEAIGNVLDKLFTSDEEKLDKEALLARLAQQPYLAQAEINRIEAQHRSVFVAGWRPAIGWVCAAALFWTYLGHPLFVWAAALWAPGLTPPALGTEDVLFELVLAMLGLGSLRTFEKTKGRAR